MIIIENYHYLQVIRILSINEFDRLIHKEKLLCRRRILVRRLYYANSWPLDASEDKGGPMDAGAVHISDTICCMQRNSIYQNTGEPIYHIRVRHV
jgi:hypothetical protein